ncbi:MAG: hypothetical protein IJY84_02130 [Clostridia bacterium]|nr:hypothetical protein [Clostridia bacterium]
MKKILSLVTVFALLFGLTLSVFRPVNTVRADEYTVECSDEENLAINKHNWFFPTLNSAQFTVDETSGMKFDNFIKDQQCVTYFRGGNFSEFKLSLLVNANLNIPEKGAQWKYSEAYITFLIDRAPEDALAEDGKPWYANKVYGSFCFGLTSGGLPISRFMYYNAFASNCQTSGQFYQPSGYTDVNVVDGKDHWIEIEIKNYNNDGVTGKKWIAYIDGVKVAEFDRDDDYYYDSDTAREYEVKYSELSGGIGIYTNSDWPGGYAPSRMNNFLEVKKAKLISYDDNPEGEVVGQCAAPVFKITANEYQVAPSYDAGDPVEIQLSDLFVYEGTDEVTYEVTCNGEPIGEIINGFWAWIPTTEGSYDIDFTATVSEDNLAKNYLTIRVNGSVEPESSTNTESNAESVAEGCGGSIATTFFPIALLAGVVLIIKRRNNE